MRTSSRVNALCILALMVVLMLCIGVAASAEFVLPEGLALAPVYLHSVSTGQNVVAGELSTQVGTFHRIPLNAGILLSTDFRESGNWGADLTVTIGRAWRVGVGGIAGVSGPVATISFAL